LTVLKLKSYILAFLFSQRFRQGTVVQRQ